MKYLLLIIATTFLNASCNKERLPEYYFKCKLNGQEYVPDNCANCRDCKLLGDTTLMLRGNRGFETLGIGINDKGGIKTGNYLLHEVIGRRGDYKFSTIPNDRYFTDATHTGQLIITELDKINKIISGTFYFKAYNSFRNDSVTVTEGKFRLQYKIN